MIAEKKAKPAIPRYLLWEYDFDKFDFDRSAMVVIERVIERGHLKEWHEILRYYGREKVLEVARKSRQLDRKSKAFTELFVDSNLNAF